MTADPVALSEEFLLGVRRGEDVTKTVEAIAGLEERTLVGGLDSDGRKLAFWINVYNAATQHALETQPDRYEDKRSFFTAALVTVAGRELSLDDIEHRILRRSYSKFTLGYLRSPFRDEFFERHQLDSRDPRIHFALNCGAESCPAIAAYTAAEIDEQLDLATESYLEQTVEYDPEKGTVSVPRVMLWFRGDFGWKSGLVAFLARYEQLPPGVRPRFTHRSWDWSMSLGKFAERERSQEKS